MERVGDRVNHLICVTGVDSIVCMPAYEICAVQQAERNGA